MDAKLHRLLLILRGALARTLSSSSEAHEAVQEMKREGWSLYLVVDQQAEDDGAGTALQLTAGCPPAESPPFKIDGRDLTFLRSIGIDPTRSLRRKRS